MQAAREGLRVGLRGTTVARPAGGTQQQQGSYTRVQGTIVAGRAGGSDGSNSRHHHHGPDCNRRPQDRTLSSPAGSAEGSRPCWSLRNYTRTGPRWAACRWHCHAYPHCAGRAWRSLCREEARSGTAMSARLGAGSSCLRVCRRPAPLGRLHPRRQARTIPRGQTPPRTPPQTTDLRPGESDPPPWRSPTT